MTEDYVTRSEVIVLIDERSIKLTEKVDAIHIDLVKLTASVGVTMKYIAGGVVVWAFKQVIELVQTFHH
jgi:hypothetical protein